MDHLISAIPYTVAALLAVTLLCTVGSIASRKWKFNFVYLSIFSYLTYIFLGYFVAGKANLSIVILASLVVGFYDAVVAWKLCVVLNANMGIEAEQIKNLSTSKALTIMLFMAPFFAFIGSLFS